MPWDSLPTTVAHILLGCWLVHEDEVVINDRCSKDSRHRHGGYWTTGYTPGMSGHAQARPHHPQFIS
jgi:hypothetical protein